MKGDFSRLTFDPQHNYSQVLLQQGRVLLDSDFNELAAISAYRARHLARDIFGRHAGPVNADGTGDPGFFISIPNPGDALQAGIGRYYVDGLGVGIDTAVQYDPSGDLNLDKGALNLLYLDVWERHVTWLDNDDVIEPALDGPDTATRAQVAWAIRGYSLRNVKSPEKITDWTTWLDTNLRRWPRLTHPAAPLILPQLVAWTDPQASDDDTPCVADPAGGYRGLENQLYRVEIHTPGDSADGGNPTFKWSRENGSAAAPWVGLEGDDLLVEGIHDTARGFSAGQWVELTSLKGEDAGIPGVMVQLVKVDGLRLTIDPSTASAQIPAAPENLDHPVVRRWDQREQRSDKSGFRAGAVVLDESHDFYTLESGIKIAFPHFDKNSKNIVTTYRTGDYWLIPARPAVGDILWPHVADPNATGRNRSLPEEPAGVEHVYAPLALVQLDAAGKPALSGKPLQLKYVPNVKGY